MRLTIETDQVITSLHIEFAGTSASIKTSGTPVSSIPNSTQVSKSSPVAPNVAPSQAVIVPDTSGRDPLVDEDFMNQKF